MGYSALKAKVGVDKSACQDSDKEGRIDLFGDKGKHNGDDRGKKSPEACKKRDLLADGSESRLKVLVEIGVGIDIGVISIDILICRVIVRKIILNIVNGDGDLGDLGGGFVFGCGCSGEKRCDTEHDKAHQCNGNPDFAFCGSKFHK